MLLELLVTCIKKNRKKIRKFYQFVSDLISSKWDQKILENSEFDFRDKFCELLISHRCMYQKIEYLFVKLSSILISPTPSHLNQEDHQRLVLWNWRPHFVVNYNNLILGKARMQKGLSHKKPLFFFCIRCSLTNSAELINQMESLFLVKAIA